MLVVKNILRFEIKATNEELFIIIPDQFKDKKLEMRKFLEKHYEIWIDPWKFIKDDSRRKQVVGMYCEHYLISQLNRRYSYKFLNTIIKKDKGE